ncbi:MAG: hypothetical protein IKG18_04440 [Atopobiaceae bacterium]|nr:hypothetical protein [Atopobiaceae bacterium]MBR3313370.1 hypothetical protein [Atopobiaceae bacterium]
MAQKTVSDSALNNVEAYVRSHPGGTLTWRRLDKLCGTPSSNLQYDRVIAPLVAAKAIEASTTSLAKGSEKRPIYREYRIADEPPQNLGLRPQSVASASARSSASAAEGPADRQAPKPNGDAPAKSTPQKPVATVPTPGTQASRAASGPDLSGYLSNLSPELTANGYLASNLPFAKAWYKELRAVSAWLDCHEGDVDPVLLEERSYEVFRNEKLLSPRSEPREGVRLHSLLKSVGVLERLAIIEVAPTLQHYLPYGMRKNLSMLIVENHVPYVRLQEELKRGRHRFFGRHVDGVIYGAGSAVSREGVLDETERLFSRGGPVRYLYWGDIDRPGILAYEQLREEREIELLIGAYEAMLDAGVDEELPVAGGATRLLHNGIDLAAQLNRARLETYLRVIADDLRIPQEAVAAEQYCGATLAERRMRPTQRVRLPLLGR